VRRFAAASITVERNAVVDNTILPANRAEEACKAESACARIQRHAGLVGKRPPQ
jgi:hypothetical protein